MQTGTSVESIAPVDIRLRQRFVPATAVVYHSGGLASVSARCSHKIGILDHTESTKDQRCLMPIDYRLVLVPRTFQYRVRIQGKLLVQKYKNIAVFGRNRIRITTLLLFFGLDFLRPNYQVLYTSPNLCCNLRFCPTNDWILPYVQTILIVRRYSSSTTAVTG